MSSSLNIIIFIIVFLIGVIMKTANAKEQIIIKYKEYEKIDLSDLAVDGKLVTPTDLTIHEYKFKVLREELYERTNFIDKSENENNLIR